MARGKCIKKRTSKGHHEKRYYLDGVLLLKRSLFYGRTAAGARERRAEALPEAAWHDVVQIRIDGAVKINAGLGEKQVEKIEPGMAGEAVVDEQAAKRKPRHGEKDDDDDKHPKNLAKGHKKARFFSWYFSLTRGPVDTASKA